jgi:hypothetical protein
MADGIRQARPVTARGPRRSPLPHVPACLGGLRTKGINSKRFALSANHQEAIHRFHSGFPVGWRAFAAAAADFDLSRSAPVERQDMPSTVR